MLRKKLFPVAGVALLSALAMAIPAQANHGAAGPVDQLNDDDAYGAGACQFAGVSGQAPGGVRAIVPDFNDTPSDGGDWVPVGQLLDTDGSQFTFGGDATCAAVDVGGNTIGVVPTESVHISAKGHFTNLICGTGHADGVANAVSNAPNNNVDIATRFGIDFVEGNGVLTINHVDGKFQLDAPLPVGEADPGDQDIDNGIGAGYVNIRPTGVEGEGNCITEDVTAFSVTGAFAITASGDIEDNNVDNT